MEYQIEIIPIARELLANIKDRREQRGLRKRIEQLKIDPDRQGKALSGKLKGYRSIRALGQRYRIVYQKCGFKASPWNGDLTVLM
jgi:mRNA interferase RelE/StbE